jgi:peptidoglycan/xylan/chitin deacetylase (PgdA/CDA1 family)/folate-dependent phosphoribosylglycinamide formyltransferase PurN
MTPEFRVVILSSGEAAPIRRLIERIHREVPRARVCGILSERRAPKPGGARMMTFVRSLADPDFVRYVGHRVRRAAGRSLARAGERLLDLAHGSPGTPGPAVSLDDLARELGVAVHVTTDYHAEPSLAFVRGLAPDLGVVYGTRILKPALFSIPTHGSINIHKRKVPDYRGGGPIGLWELLDGEREIGVTVHEVTEKLDAGRVVHAATIPIQPFDSLASLALKAHVVGNDLLVRAVADFADGTARPRPQQGTGRMFKSPTAAQLLRYERELARRRPGYRAAPSRPVTKLLAKTALALPGALARNRRARRTGRFPVTILFHHLVADRPHRMGISTDRFVRHVAFLRRHYRIASLAQALAMLEAGRVEVPTVVLTFDDGYADNFLTLRAVAEETGLPMTLFVSTAHLTSGEEFAHDRRAGEPGFAPLTWEELGRMHREGFEIGSHTRTHFDCGARDRVRLEDEIVGSRRDLEARLGVPVELFSFPGGRPENISAEAASIAARTYRHVFSAFGGLNVPGCDVLHLKRAFHAGHLWDLELHLQGVLEREPAFIWRVERVAPVLPERRTATAGA